MIAASILSNTGALIAGIRNKIGPASITGIPGSKPRSVAAIGVKDIVALDKVFVYIFHHDCITVNIITTV